MGKSAKQDGLISCKFYTKSTEKPASLQRIKTNESRSSGNPPWGIYLYRPRRRTGMGDPLRTVIEAPTKLAAEEEAA